MVWFNNLVKKPKGNQSLYGYYHKDKGISKSFEKKINRVLKSKWKDVYSEAGTRGIAKKLKKSIKDNVSVSVLCFRVYGKKGTNHSYKHFTGTSLSMNFTVGHFSSAVGFGGNCNTEGCGWSTAKAGMAVSYSKYKYSAQITKSFRRFFDCKMIQRRVR